MTKPRKTSPAGEGEEAARAGDYEVGYGRPPRATRFQPGLSGNPKGRPKGAKNLETLVTEKLNMKVTVREGGREKSMTKAEVGVTKLVNRFVETGDLKILSMLAKFQEATRAAAIGGKPEELDDASEHASNEAVLAWFLEQHRKAEDET